MSRQVFDSNQSVRYPDNTLFYGLIVTVSIISTLVTVGITAIKLPTVPLLRRKFIVIFNNSSNILYIGDSTVTTAAGYPVYPRGQMSLAVEDNIDIYGIASAGSSDIRVFEGS